jgi:glycosyltransferase involved in cell wall biosynthesis
LVSVVIPVYNAERYLAEAIESVLCQSFGDYEIIVVDDGSTDGSAAVAGSYGSSIRYRSQPHRGAAATRNVGVAKARGRFFSFLDADDAWTADKLEKQVAAFEEDAELDIVFGHVQEAHSPELDEGARQKTRVSSEIRPGYFASTMMVKRDSFFRVGPFATTWRVGEGVDWHLRATDLQLRMLMLPDVVLWRRVHEKNMGIRLRDARQDYVHIVKAALDRRRAT